MIPFCLVTGFLGSGKTTLLQGMLNRYSEEKKIAVIQNEFAPSGTDGKVLQMEGHPFKLVEVNNGSVFCVCMLSTFVQTLEKVIEEYAPELIILEASGLSDPVNIIEILQDAALRDKTTLSGIFAVVDAPNFLRSLERMNRVRHQVMIADTVIMNKMDLYQGDSGELQDTLKAINPFAEIVETRYCRLDPDRYVLLNSVEHKAAVRFGKKESEGRPAMKTGVLRIHKRISLDNLLQFIREIQADCPRIKGFVNTADGKVYGIQTVFESIEYREVHGYTGPTEIIAFGDDISPGLLRKMFIRYTAS